MFIAHAHDDLIVVDNSSGGVFPDESKCEQVSVLMTLIGRYPNLDAQTRDLLEQVCSCWSIIVPSNVDGVVVVGIV